MAVRVVVLLGLALLIGVGTVVFAKRWIASIQPAAPLVVREEFAPDRLVLVAQGNLQPGTLLGPDSFRWQGWPTEDLPPSYVVQGKRSDSDFHGAVVRYQISAGEPITDFKIAKPGERGFLAAVLTPGMRAVTVPISEARAAAGFILPGDRVDVILTHEAEFGIVSETVFHDMRVLAIDQALSAAEGPVRLGRTATVEVTPREAEAFTVMQQMGAVSLSLRSLQPGGPGIPQDEQQVTQALADAAMSEKPESVGKVPTVYPGEGPADSVADASQPIESVDNAVGQTLWELDTAVDEHSSRRQNQTFTGGRDVSVLLGGGGGGTGAVVVIRGSANH